MGGDRLFGVEDTVVRGYGDPRIKLQRLQQNAGAAKARNIAVAQALGDFLAIVDSDDISRPNRLELLAAALRTLQ
jgi:glycosyltransferase involved in cell wall biosynthesis